MLTELQRSLVKLTSFQTVNCTGFLKLLQRLEDPVFPAALHEQAMGALRASALIADTRTTSLQADVRCLFANLFTRGDVNIAEVMKMMGRL